MQRDMARVEEELQAAARRGVRGRRRRPRRRHRQAELVSSHDRPDAVDPDDVEMLQDLVLAAVNEALRASRDLETSKMAAVTGGLRLPGM